MITKMEFAFRNGGCFIIECGMEAGLHAGQVRFRIQYPDQHECSFEFDRDTAVEFGEALVLVAKSKEQSALRWEANRKAAERAKTEG